MKNIAVLSIDIQQDYFPGGACELVGPTAAANAAARVLEFARSRPLPVVHVRQRTPPEAGLGFLERDTPGEAFHPAVEPAAGELVVEKVYPSAFQGTELESELRTRSVDHLVVVGMMTHLCVAATVHAAFERGFTVTLLADATATRRMDGPDPVEAHDLQRAQLAALSGVFAEVSPVSKWLEAQSQLRVERSRP